MQTYISDIIPKLQRFGSKLDNLTLLTNQHWVVIDEIENSKTVYIFRTNYELLISKNGKVEKAKWEYLGHNSLLIDNSEGSFLFKHGFFDENILALKIDSKDEYAFLINESKYNGELNSMDKILDFLTKSYLEPELNNLFGIKTGNPLNTKYKEITPKIWMKYKTQKGNLEIEHYSHFTPANGDNALLNGISAPDGKYKVGFLYYIHIFKGKIVDVTMF